MQIGFFFSLFVSEPKQDFNSSRCFFFFDFYCGITASKRWEVVGEDEPPGAAAAAAAAACALWMAGNG